MKILSMTATFGKLSSEVLTLQPGLNVIHAPNEWGKSTWCAFAIAMLYGVDTKERTTKDSFAVKEQYKPWSGAEMSGRMDILWNGKAITLERSSKGRVPMGQFRAYETDTGIPVAELTADNCGQTLLGVEKSVFTRAGFLKMTDMPVTQDEALRRRLNALVTTGDESGAADDLMQKLRDLKNRCRHNKTGELPKAEAQKAELESKLAQLEDLKLQSGRITQRQAQVKGGISALENHITALQYAASLETAQRLQSAEKDCAQAKQQLEEIQTACENLPEQAYLQDSLRQLEQLSLQQTALAGETLPSAEAAPVAPSIFAGLTAQQAAEQARTDKASYDTLNKAVSPLWLILAVLFALAGIFTLSSFYWIALFAAAAALAVVYFVKGSAKRKAKETMLAKYQGVDSSLWIATAVQYQDAVENYNRKNAVQTALQADLQRRKETLQAQIDSLTQGKTVAEATAYLTGLLSQRQAYAKAQEAYRQAKQRAEELGALITKVAPPTDPDNLTLSKEQTRQQLIALQAESQQLQRNLGLCQGQMHALGQADGLTKELARVNARIEQLENYYSATVLAMETLEKATTELQRRFAPQISGRAQELFNKLTGGRYDRLQLTQDFCLEAGAVGENTLSDSRFRSDGTVDQLYLALRLAVAEALTPNAPLVLDDALVRFDDTRLARAMEILKDSAKEKQVIVFTCHKREENYL